MARVGVEPTTLALLAPRSNQLSYPAISFRPRVLRIDKLLQASRFYEFWEPGGDHRPVCDQLRTQPFVKSIIRLLCSCDATNPTVRAGHNRGQLGKGFAMQRVFVALETSKWDIVFCYMKDPLQIMRCHLFFVHCLLAK
ncbi:hypothetical protein T10_10434 [Trichinella papuae]|uniref:Uncharacterized protein n=1 Tax=Trichinella papuae TaxID=268474 RepID=A0A0V1N5J1_9BILA|nr:hypothetical protein T10_10434 [Trichinella papuae]